MVKDRLINIVTFLWGEAWADGQGERYAARLFNSVCRNLHGWEARLTLFTDRPRVLSDLNVELTVSQRDLAIPASLFTGCLPKLYALGPPAFLGLEPGRVLVFDLDTVVVGDLEDFASYTGRVCTRAWFRGIPHGQWLSGGDLISFDTADEELTSIWVWAMNDPEAVVRMTGGRERFVYRKMADRLGLDYWQRVCPNQYLSYKNHLRGRDQVPTTARLVSCHGDPRPHVLAGQGVPWVVDNWK